MKKSIDYFDRFTKIICWIALFRIRRSYGSLKSYLEAPVFGPRELNPKSWRMNLPWKFILALTKTSDGKKHLKEFLAKASGLLTYHRHVHRKYKSGKIFARQSWFEVDEKWLRENFDRKSSDILTADYRKWVNKHFFDGNSREKSSTAVLTVQDVS